MIRNNLLALLIHVLINIFVILVYGTPSSFPKYGFVGEMFFFLITISLYLLMGYFLTGKILIYHNSKFKNVSSISIIFILGLLVWAYQFFADVFWIFSFFIYIYYATPLYPIFEYSHHGNPLELIDLLLWFSLLPVILIWVGMELKVFTKKRIYIKILVKFKSICRKVTLAPLPLELLM